MVFAESKPTMKIASSIYVGWMPWFLAAQDGTLKKYGDLEKINIEFIEGDYIETINQFAAGSVDAVTLTNVDALALLVGTNVRSDVILIGSYSNGNDAVILKPGTSQDLIGKTVGLVEYSVSHYLLDRYLENEKIPFNQVKWINIADSEIAAAFTSSSLEGVITWNPIVLQLEQTLNGIRFYDSRSLNKEIADMLVVRGSVLEEHPEFANALLSTWFEIVSRLKNGDEQTFEDLGKLSGMDGKNYQKQLSTTTLIYNKEEALNAIKDSSLPQTMKYIHQFVDRHKLLLNPPPTPWVSYDKHNPSIINFNEQPLIQFKTKALN